MTTPTLTRPAVGLMPPGWDPRPCVNKPAQWWDLGDDGNTRAIRYCRNVCPRLNSCRAQIAAGVIPKAQIRAGIAYAETGKRIGICGDCDQPRRRGSMAGVIACGCPPAQTRADRETTA